MLCFVLGLLAEWTGEENEPARTITVPLETYWQGCVRDVDEGLEVMARGLLWGGAGVWPVKSSLGLAPIAGVQEATVSPPPTPVPAHISLEGPSVLYQFGGVGGGYSLPISSPCMAGCSNLFFFKCRIQPP